MTSPRIVPVPEYTPVKHGHNRVGSRSKEYRAWTHLIGRCCNPADKSFASYGGRGITVYPPWRDFAEFLKDVGLAPSPKHSLDRKNNDGNYEPGNVRWATRPEQSRNTQRSILIDGVCLKDACQKLGVSYGAAQARIRRHGQSPSDALRELEAKKCAL